MNSRLIPCPSLMQKPGFDIAALTESGGLSSKVHAGLGS